MHCIRISLSPIARPFLLRDDARDRLARRGCKRVKSTFGGTRIAPFPFFFFFYVASVFCAKSLRLPRSMFSRCLQRCPRYIFSPKQRATEDIRDDFIYRYFLLSESQSLTWRCKNSEKFGEVQDIHLEIEVPFTSGLTTGTSQVEIPFFPATKRSVLFSFDWLSFGGMGCEKLGGPEVLGGQFPEDRPSGTGTRRERMVLCIRQITGESLRPLPPLDGRNSERGR